MSASTKSGFSHLDEKGQARMVDVGAKEVTSRTATAGAWVVMKPDTLRLAFEGTGAKGDVLAAARIAGIMAAKRTSDLIPLCHPLPISQATIEFKPKEKDSAIAIEATVKVEGKTGVEMEALMAVSVAALTIYDMCKSVDRAITITNVRLLEKTGGKSGTYRRADP